MRNTFLREEMKEKILYIKWSYILRVLPKKWLYLSLFTDYSKNASEKTPFHEQKMSE